MECPSGFHRISKCLSEFLEGTETLDQQLSRQLYSWKLKVKHSQMAAELSSALLLDSQKVHSYIFCLMFPETVSVVKRWHLEKRPGISSKPLLDSWNVVQNAVQNTKRGGDTRTT